MGIKSTGAWEQDIADTGHLFSYYLARWIANYLPKDKKIIDLGCGKGTYLGYLYDRGFRDLQGVEGSQLNNFEFTEIIVKDLSEPFNIGKGNVLCLEVIEHIPNEFAEIVFDNICNHVDKGCKAIISCAIVGQGGDGHVNCQPNLWAISNMERRGFKLLCDDTQSARDVIENHCAYFKETLLIFGR